MRKKTHKASPIIRNISPKGVSDVYAR